MQTSRRVLCAPLHIGRVRLVPVLLVPVLLVLVPLILASCGAGSTTTTPPVTFAGSLYLVVSNAATNGPSNMDVVALNAGSGRQGWQSPLNGVSGGEVFAPGRLLVSAIQAGGAIPQGALQALYPQDGTPLWHYSPPSGVPVPLVASDTVAFVDVRTQSTPHAPAGDVLVALNTSDGSARWSTPLAGSASAAVLGPDALYVIVVTQPKSHGGGSPQASLVAVNSASGTPLWQVSLPGLPPTDSKPIWSDGVVYLITQFASTDVTAVRASAGTVLWTKVMPAGSGAGGIQVVDGTVCESYGLPNSPGGGIVALHAADGSPAWQVSTPAGPDPLATDGTAIFALDSMTSVNRLLAFDASSGRSLLAHQLPAPPIQTEFGAGTPMLVSGGKLYTIATGALTPSSTATPQPQQVSLVLALNTLDGSLAWQHMMSGVAEPQLLIGPYV